MRHSGYLRGVGTHLGSLLHTEPGERHTHPLAAFPKPLSRPARQPPTPPPPSHQHSHSHTHTRRSRERPTLASARAAKESADEEDAVKSSSPFAHEIDSSVEATSGVAGFSLLGT